MKRKITVLTSLFILSMTVSAFADNNVQVRDAFSNLGYTVNWNNDTKSILLNNKDNKINIKVSDTTINVNDKYYFNNGINLKDNYTYINGDVFSYITKLTNEPVYENTGDAVEPTENNISKDKTISNAINYINKFYNVDIANGEIAVTYYNNNTCQVMAEKDKTTYFVKFNSIKGNLISIEKTINKKGSIEREILTSNKMAKDYAQSAERIKSIEAYGSLEPIFTCIPTQNNYTIISVFKSDNGEYYAYEYADITKEPISFYVYENEDIAINSILQMI